MQSPCVPSSKIPRDAAVVDLVAHLQAGKDRSHYTEELPVRPKDWRVFVCASSLRNALLQSSTTGGLRLSERMARAVQEALQCDNRSDAERCVLTVFEENRRDQEKNSLIIDDPGFVETINQICGTAFLDGVEDACLSKCVFQEPLAQMIRHPSLAGIDVIQLALDVIRIVSSSPSSSSS